MPGGDFERSSSIDNEALGDLLDDFYDAHFFDMRDEYKGHRDVAVDDKSGLVEEQARYVTCGPTATISIRVGAFQKTVLDDFGAPPALAELAEKIDRISGAEHWVGAEWQLPPPLTTDSLAAPEEFAPLRFEDVRGKFSPLRRGSAGCRSSRATTRTRDSPRMIRCPTRPGCAPTRHGRELE